MRQRLRILIVRTGRTEDTVREDRKAEGIMKVAASIITETMKVVVLTATEAIIREEVRDVRRVREDRRAEEIMKAVVLIITEITTERTKAAASIITETV